MAGSRDRRDTLPPDDQTLGTWFNPLPVPEVKEGGESTWDAWNEAARELDDAFRPTIPGDSIPLTPAREAQQPPSRPPPGPLTVDGLMVQARWNNRVCPRPALWTELYQWLDGPTFADLPPPPPDWMWSKLTAIQKRLCFREYLEWADRHAQLPQIALFMETLTEEDWLHMGET